MEESEKSFSDQEEMTAGGSLTGVSLVRQKVRELVCLVAKLMPDQQEVSPLSKGKQAEDMSDKIGKRLDQKPKYRVQCKKPVELQKNQDGHIRMNNTGHEKQLPKLFQQRQHPYLVDDLQQTSERLSCENVENQTSEVKLEVEIEVLDVPECSKTSQSVAGSRQLLSIDKDSKPQFEEYI